MGHREKGRHGLDRRQSHHEDGEDERRRDRFARRFHCAGGSVSATRSIDRQSDRRPRDEATSRKAG
jgi:hypothetical protein